MQKTRQVEGSEWGGVGQGQEKKQSWAKGKGKASGEGVNNGQGKMHAPGRGFKECSGPPLHVAHTQFTLIDLRL